MMLLGDVAKDKKAVIFGLDDVLYPEKDYLLQVYYLFSSFMSYVAQFDAAAILNFMQQEFNNHGTTQLFEKTAAAFKIPDQYRENFLLLHQHARLPLKLLIDSKILPILQTLVAEGKEIILLLDGDPVQQLNKIKQMEWNGLEKDIKLYFTKEFAPKPSPESIDYILSQHAMKKEEVLFVGKSVSDHEFATKNELAYFAV